MIDDLHLSCSMHQSCHVTVFLFHLIYSTFQECFHMEFCILHFGYDDNLCLHFIHLLEQEGYSCYRVAYSDLRNEKCINDIWSTTQHSENYIIWISLDKLDESVKQSFEFYIKMAISNSLLYNGHYSTYIFRLNNSPVPDELEKYEMYELSSDMPFKMPEILKYLKRGSSKGICCLFYVSLFIPH